MKKISFEDNNNYQFFIIFLNQIDVSLLFIIHHLQTYLILAIMVHHLVQTYYDKFCSFVEYLFLHVFHQISIQILIDPIFYRTVDIVLKGHNVHLEVLMDQ